MLLSNDHNTTVTVRISIIAIGSLGDILYYLPLARALIEHGDSVQIIGHKNFAHLVAERNIPFLPLSLDSDAFLESEGGQALNATRGSVLRARRSYAQLFTRYLIPLGREIERYCQETDLMIATPLAIPISYHIAEKLRIPILRGSTFPMQETSAYPPAVSIALTKYGIITNRMAHKIEEYAEGRIATRVVNRFRVNYLGLPRIGAKFSYRRRGGDCVPQLLCVSSAIIPRPNDWPDDTHAYGLWNSPPSADHAPALSDRVERFIRDGSPPFYIGFGSMSEVLASKVFGIAEEVVERTGERVVIFGGLSERNIESAGALSIGYTPHAVLFPRMVLAVHHGGASTLHSAVRAAKPSIIVPFAHDQSFWGERCYQLGIGPRPIPQDKLTAARLSAAITEALKTPRYWERAKQLQQQMIIEERDSMDKAMAAIHDIARRFGQGT